MFVLCVLGCTIFGIKKARVVSLMSLKKLYTEKIAHGDLVDNITIEKTCIF